MNFEAMLKIYEEKRKLNNVDIKNIYTNSKIYNDGGKFYIILELNTFGKLHNSLIETFKEIETEINKTKTVIFEEKYNVDIKDFNNTEDIIKFIEEKEGIKIDNEDVDSVFDKMFNIKRRDYFE